MVWIFPFPQFIMKSSKSQRLALKINEKECYFMPEFKTIRQAAASGVLSEHRIRVMVAQGQCPGIQAGNRFLVNMTALVEMLDAMSRMPQEVKSE